MARWQPRSADLDSVCLVTCTRRVPAAKVLEQRRADARDTKQRTQLVAAALADVIRRTTQTTADSGHQPGSVNTQERDVEQAGQPPTPQACSSARSARPSARHTRKLDPKRLRTTPRLLVSVHVVRDQRHSLANPL